MTCLWTAFSLLISLPINCQPGCSFPIVPRTVQACWLRTDGPAWHGRARAHGRAAQLRLVAHCGGFRTAQPPHSRLVGFPARFYSRTSLVLSSSLSVLHRRGPGKGDETPTAFYRSPRAGPEAPTAAQPPKCTAVACPWPCTPRWRPPTRRPRPCARPRLWGRHSWARSPLRSSRWRMSGPPLPATRSWSAWG